MVRVCDTNVGGQKAVLGIGILNTLGNYKASHTQTMVCPGGIRGKFDRLFNVRHLRTFSIIYGYP